jgi:ribosome-associated translation inhibitor RaiA
MYVNIRMLHIDGNEIFENMTRLVDRRSIRLGEKYPEIHGLDVVITEPHRRSQSGRRHDVLLSVSVDRRGVVTVHGQEPQGEFDNPLAAVDHAFDMLENRLRHAKRVHRRSPRATINEEQIAIP